MNFKTLAWKGDYLELIDQTRLPGRKAYLACRTMEDVWKAIREMKVRGAPAIGVTAAFGIYLGLKSSRARDKKAFLSELAKDGRRMAACRPTARNLFDTIERMEKAAAEAPGGTVALLKRRFLKKALAIRDEDVRLCRAIGRHGAGLFRSGDAVLTHCNAGALATAGIGTALAAVYEARSGGKDIRVFATETRPFLQGARLTAWELAENRVPVTLLCDNMVAALLRSGKVDRVIVGADRIAANGDTANKIGTYGIAELARAHGIPFYVAAPSTTFDFSLPSGKQIPIEIRDAAELGRGFRKPVHPKKIGIFNPAFDVTPHRLITAIVTEKGVFRPPFQRTLKRLNSGAK
jgi:methylthioribose-1-phosphate isomerase